MIVCTIFPAISSETAKKKFVADFFLIFYAYVPFTVLSYLGVPLLLTLLWSLLVYCQSHVITETFNREVRRYHNLPDICDKKCVVCSVAIIRVLQSSGVCSVDQ